MSAAPEPSIHVVWVGDGPPAGETLATAGVALETMPLDSSAEELSARAPDLVVLAGAATTRANILEAAFEDHEVGAAVSVAVLEDLRGRDHSEPSKRGGIVARLSDALPPERLAAALADLVRQLARPVWDVSLPSSVVASVTAAAGGDTLAGVVVSEDPALVIVVGTHLAPKPDGGPLLLRVAPRARGSVRVLSAASDASGSDGVVRGAPICVVASAMEPWARVADALREGGADVELLTSGVEGLELARARDPMLVVVDAVLLREAGATALAEDARLAACRLLVMGSEVASVIAPGALRAEAGVLVAHELDVRARIERGELVVDRIEALGPARWLKAIGRSADSVALELRGPAGVGRIALAAGKVRDASFVGRDATSPALSGREALQASLATTYGTVLAGPRDAVGRGRPPIAARTTAADPKASIEAARPAVPAKTAPARPEALRVPMPAKAAPAKADPSRAPALVKTEPVKTEPVKTEPVKTKPVKTEPVKTKPVKTEPVKTEPVKTEPVKTEPVKTEPVKTEPTKSGRPKAAARNDEVVEPEPPRAAAPRTSMAGAVLAMVAALALVFFAYRAAGGGRDDDASAVGRLDAGIVAASAPQEPDAGSAGALVALDVGTDDAGLDAAAESLDAGADAGDITARLAEADDAIDAREFARAAELARSVLAESPESSPAAYDLALALLRRQQNDEALVWALRASEWDPSEPRGHMLLADVYRQTGRRPQARRELSRCLEVSPDFEPCQRARVTELDALEAARATPPP